MFVEVGVLHPVRWVSSWAVDARPGPPCCGPRRFARGDPRAGRAAALEDAGSMAAPSARSDVVWSSPASRRAGSGVSSPMAGAFVDANAVSPITAHLIGATRAWRSRRRRRHAARCPIGGSSCCTSGAPTRRAAAGSSRDVRSSRSTSTANVGASTSSSPPRLVPGPASGLLSARGGSWRGSRVGAARAWGSTPSRPSAGGGPVARRNEGLTLGRGMDGDRRHLGRRASPDGLPRAALEVFDITTDYTAYGAKVTATPPADGANEYDGLQALKKAAAAQKEAQEAAQAPQNWRPSATIRRRPWPTRPPNSPSPNARSPTPAPPAACAATARCPACSTAAATIRPVRRRRPRAAPRARRPRRGLELELGGAAHARRAAGRPAPSSARAHHARRPPARRPQRRHPRDRPVELVGDEDAPGVVEGGVLEHVTRELNIEALPNEIPERHRGRRLQDGDERHAQLSAVTAPKGVTLLDDPDETVVATLTPPELQADVRGRRRGRIETETEVVGEGEAPRTTRPRATQAATTPPTRAPSSAARAPALRRGVGSGRLAGRRARQPGRALRAHAAQRRLRRRRGARAALGAAAPQAEVRRALHRGPHGARRPPRRRAAAADLHERGRAAPPARRAARCRSSSTTCSSCTTRSTCRSATSARAWAAASRATTG